MKVKAPGFLLRLSQACQSQSHLKCDLKMSFGQFFVTNVTAGQLMELPNLRIRRLAWRDLSDFLRWIGNSSMRLILRLVLVNTFSLLRIS